MRVRKSVYVLLILVAVGIAAACGAVFFLGDREGPVVSFIGDPVQYVEGDSKEALLSNVVAYDYVDEDVTNLVIVDAVTPIRGSSTAEVRYIAKDNSNNITVATQLVDYVSDDTENMMAEEDFETGSDRNDSKAAVSAAKENSEHVGTTDKAEEPAGDSAVNAQTAPANDSTVKKHKKDDSTVKTDSTDEGIAPTETVNSSDSTNETKAREPLEPTNPAAQATPTDSAAPAESAAPATPTDSAAPATPENPAAPVITLTTDTVHIPVGGTFDYAQYVGSITDDKDDLYTLSRKINLSGDYNTQKAGTYKIAYYVDDTDGNYSKDAYLTLIVE